MIKDGPAATFKSFRPFGPTIGVIKLNDFVVNKFLQLTDEILSDDKRKSWGHHLAGQIIEEPYISNDALVKYDLYDFLNDIQKKYVESVTSIEHAKTVETKITNAWIVSQYENEYNPLHWHESCTISAVLYLKVPEYVPRNIPGKREDQDGKIVFVNYNPSAPAVSFENPIYTFSPEPGDMFMFPSRTLHGVYPFQGEGERRSVSFNGLHIPVKT